MGGCLGERFKNYYYGMMLKLREGFDLLLKMFWACGGTNQMLMVEAAEAAD